MARSAAELLRHAAPPGRALVDTAMTQCRPISAGQNFISARTLMPPHSPVQKYRFAGVTLP